MRDTVASLVKSVRFAHTKSVSSASTGYLEVALALLHSAMAFPLRTSSRVYHSGRFPLHFFNVSFFVHDYIFLQPTLGLAARTSSRSNTKAVLHF